MSFNTVYSQLRRWVGWQRRPVEDSLLALMAQRERLQASVSGDHQLEKPLWFTLHRQPAAKRPDDAVSDRANHPAA